ncbi:hypothetical protein MFIFM68171_09654 [Madurella fahalii]|uniref:Ankyrin n=1 Tax=Madurella fahalii TaxID=1157608 RepID=A0ABQ0GNY4_9PEZI
MNPNMEEACSNGDLEALQKCLEMMRKPTADNDGDAGILDRLQPGSIDVIHKAASISVECRQLSTFTFLLDRVGELIITGPIVRSICSNADRLEFCTALLQRGYALSSPQSIQWLLDHGADPNKPPLTSSRLDLLAIAAATSAPQVVELLVKYGAKTRGTQALHMAADASANLIDADEDEWEVDPTRVAILRILLDAGANINEMEPDPKGPAFGYRDPRQRALWTGTPLHHAVYRGSVEAVECLLSHGADVLAPSWSGHIPMQAAEKAGRQYIIDMLMRYM